MGVVSGRARMSSRGQIVIPKVLREAAGMAAGDEVEVILDGQRLILCPCRRDGDQAGLPAPESDGLVREARPGYGVAGDSGGCSGSSFHSLTTSRLQPAERR